MIALLAGSCALAHARALAWPLHSAHLWQDNLQLIVIARALALTAVIAAGLPGSPPRTLLVPLLAESGEDRGQLQRLPAGAACCRSR